jgi:RND family efflux transporter MFP subunit
MNLLRVPFTILKLIYRRLVVWYGRRAVVFLGLLSLALVLLVLIKLGSDGGTANEPETTPIRDVTVRSIRELQDSSAGYGSSLLGTVESVREARLVTEAGGRITSVTVRVGDRIGAGKVLATIENSRERAVVLQAQGAYESALAGSSAGDVSLTTATKAFDEAKNTVANTYRSSFTTLDGVVRNSMDRFFSDPTGSFPGLMIEGRGSATLLSSERVALENVLRDWKAKQNGTITVRDLDVAEANARRISSVLAQLSTLFAQDDNVRPELSEQGVVLTQARSQVDAALAQISGARSQYIASDNALTQARIASANTGVSASDAQLKQALGALKLAEANLEKTIVRSPISGVVQSLPLREGSAVAPGVPAAIVASEGGLEITAFISENDARSYAVGDTVTIDGTTSGTVTQVATALDQQTKKIELRIGTNESASLINGQSVRITKDTQNQEQVSESDTLLLSSPTLPISAIKMTPAGAVVFTVSEDGILEPHALTLGEIVGDRVVAKDGITSQMKIVTDARGLRAGMNVSVK